VDKYVNKYSNLWISAYASPEPSITMYWTIFIRTSASGDPWLQPRGGKRRSFFGAGAPGKSLLIDKYTYI